MSDYTFKLAMFTTELRLPYHQAFPKAKEIGADRLWYAPSAGDLPFEAMTDADMDRIGACAEQHQTEIFFCSAEAVSLRPCISAIWIWTIWKNIPNFREPERN